MGYIDPGRGSRGRGECIGLGKLRNEGGERGRVTVAIHGGLPACLGPSRSSYRPRRSSSGVPRSVGDRVSEPLPLSCLYRRSALIEVGGWQLQGGYEDWDLWMTFAERGWKSIGIPEVTAYYRVQSGRRLSRSSRRHAERYARLRARHPSLFAERSRNRRSL